MERVIKFKGKSQLGLNPYVQGNLFIDSNNNYFIVNDMNDGNINFCKVFDESVGQFTGVKDKHGKEVYEGDIISFGEDYRIEEISFKDGCFGYENKGSIEYFTPLIENEPIYYEIIGNIYENPELLEQ